MSTKTQKPTTYEPSEEKVILNDFISVARTVMAGSAHITGYPKQPKPFAAYDPTKPVRLSLNPKTNRYMK